MIISNDETGTEKSSKKTNDPSVMNISDANFPPSKILFVDIFMSDQYGIKCNSVGC